MTAATKAREPKAEVVMGEIVGGGKPKLRDLTHSIAGCVRARHSQRKFQGAVVEERLYECANGWALGARRGGPSHLSDGESWEVFMLSPKRIRHGEVLGFQSTEFVERCVAKLALYREPWQSPIPAGTCSR